MIIEEVIKNFFDGHLDVPSFFEHELTMPDTFVMIERVGGSQKNKLPTARVAFQSYAPSLYEAAELNEKVKLVVESMVEEDLVSGVRLNSDYNFTDIETRQYRYQALYEIFYY